MRLVSILIIAFAVGSALSASSQAVDGSQAKQSRTIRGVVLTANDKKPISGVLVSLDPSHVSMTTNEKGEFVFTGVPLQTEVVSVHYKNGFLCGLMFSGFRPAPNCVLNVDPISVNVQVTLTMLPAAAVAGRVVDQRGNPIRNLPLHLMSREITGDGYYAWRVLGMSIVKTDVNGAFRMTNIEPGSYLLHIPTAFDSPDPSPPAHPSYGYSDTYFPGVSDQKSARPIVLGAGEEATADLTLRREPVQSVTLNYVPDFPFGSVFPQIEVSDQTAEVSPGPQPVVRNAHSFSFIVPPGRYDISFGFQPSTDPETGKPLPWPDGKTTHYTGSAKFEVRDQPIAIENIPLTPVEVPINISLNVHAQLTRPVVRGGIQIQPHMTGDTGMNFQLDSENFRFNNRFDWLASKPVSTFEFKNVPVGQYAVRAFGDETYPASLTCGGLNLLREPLIIGQGAPGCSIEAVIRDDFAHLSIGLSDTAKAQMTAYGTTITDVALIPLDNALSPPYSGFVRRAEGPREVEIPPGSYIAFLFDGRRLAWRDPETQRQLRMLGTIVTLAPGDAKTLLLDFKPELDDPRIQPAGVSLGRLLQ